MNLLSSNPLFVTATGAILAYLIGSLSFAVIVSRFFGLDDPRTYGSGNPGATNVLRSGNKGAAILTLLFDALKGYAPVLLAYQLGLSQQAVAAIGLGAFVGHLWPVFFKFEGGKGVATAAGVLLGFSGALGGLVLLVWLVMAILFRYSSLAALTAALAAPLIQYFGWGLDERTYAVIVMSALLIWRHEANIRKLLAGQESKLGQKTNGSAANKGRRRVSQPGQLSRSSWVTLAVILAAVLGLVEVVHWWQSSRQAADIAKVLQERAVAPLDVVMYTTSSCPYCTKARAWLSDNRVPFKECNIEHEASCQGDFESQGSPGVPLLRVRGLWHLGFDAGWLIEALQAQPATSPSTVTSPRP